MMAVEFRLFLQLKKGSRKQYGTRGVIEVN